jgi:hypothetical protein
LEGVDLGRRPEDVNGSETLCAQAIGCKGSSQTPEVAIDDSLVDNPASTSGVPCRHDRGREGEDDRDGGQPGHGRPGHEGSPRCGLDVRSVNDHELPGGEAPLDIAVEERKRGPGRPLVRRLA